MNMSSTTNHSYHIHTSTTTNCRLRRDSSRDSNYSNYACDSVICVFKFYTQHKIRRCRLLYNRWWWYEPAKPTNTDYMTHIYDYVFCTLPRLCMVDVYWINLTERQFIVFYCISIAVQKGYWLISSCVMRTKVQVILPPVLFTVDCF